MINSAPPGEVAEGLSWQQALELAGDDAEALVERAAIYEFDGGLTRAEAEQRAAKWYQTRRLQRVRRSV